MQNTQYVIRAVSHGKPIDMANLFAPYSHQAWSLLLDSAGQREQDSRYDILLHTPAITIETRGSQTRVVDHVNNTATDHTDDPIELARGIHQHFIHSVNHIDSVAEHDLPFIAGIAGMFGYDLGRRFEHVPYPFSERLDCPDMALGLYTRSLIYDKQQQCLYDCRPLNAQPFTLPESDHHTAQAFKLTSAWQSNTSHAHYVNNIGVIKDYLVAGDCYQVNFAQRFTARYQGDEWQAYCQLRAANKAPFSTYMRLDNNCILSISPERFLSVKDGVVETKPIKGTRPRGATPDKDNALAAELVSSEKDRAENLMIVDLLRNDISKHCKPMSVKVPKPFELESFAAVHHLVSTVTGELDEHSDPFALLRDAFPGGSITGAPKIRAMQVIDELETAERNIYCGSIGYVGLHMDMDTSICIRTLLTENGNIHCWAGGGIVLDSDAEAEYQETLDKVNKILPVLA
jgi:para-aminobenzoate synthetase component 1